MQDKIIEELRQELKEQTEENKELNDSITWWKNRYEAQVKINKEHKKLNGNLRKENDALITVIDLAREKIENIRIFGLRSGKTLIATLLNDILEILERVNEK